MMDYCLKYLQSHWKDIIKGTSVVDFKKGQTLFYAGHYPNGVFVILSGELHFEKGNSCKSADEHYSKIDISASKASVRGRLHPALPVEGATQAPMIDQGKVVGLPQIIADTPSCCSCIATTDCKTIFISKTLLEPTTRKTSKKRS